MASFPFWRAIYSCSFFFFSNQVSVDSCFGFRDFFFLHILSRDVPADGGFLCDKAAVLVETIKETLCVLYIISGI